MKVADLGYGSIKAAPEYQDCKRLADQTGRPIREIMEDAAFAYRQQRPFKGKNAKGKLNVAQQTYGKRKKAKSKKNTSE